MLAAALGTFASAHAATWTRSQGDQASYAAGADVRVERRTAQGAVPDWGIGRGAAGGPGRHGGDAGRGRLDQLGTTVRDGTLLGVDGAAMADIVRVRDDEQGAETLDAAARARRRPAARRSGRDPDPRAARAGSRSSRTRRSSRSRATCRSPTTRRASASRSSSSTPMAGSRGCRAAPVRSTRTACASSPRSPVPTAPGWRCRRRSSASSSTSRRAATSRSRSRGPWTCASLEASTEDDGDALDAAPGRGRPDRDRARAVSLQEVDAPAPLPERVEIPAPVRAPRASPTAGCSPAAMPPPAAIPSTTRSSTAPAPRSATRSRRASFGAPLEVQILDSSTASRRSTPGKPFALVDVQALGLLRLAAQVALRGDGGVVARDGARASAAVAAGLAAAPIEATGRRGPHGRRGRPRGGPARAGRDRDPRARVARRARVRRDRLPRERQRVDDTSAWASSRCSRRWGSRRGSCSRGSRSRTSRCSSSGWPRACCSGSSSPGSRCRSRRSPPSGEPPVPAPVVVVPLEALVPTLVLRPPARRRDGRARAAPAPRRPGRARSCARGTSRWAGPGSPSAGCATTVPPTLGLALLVLVTAFLAALAPRVIAGAGRQRGPVRGHVRDGLGAEHRAARGPGSPRGPGRRPARRSSARPGSSTRRRSRPPCGRSIASRSAVVESARFRLNQADDGPGVRQAPDPGGDRRRTSATSRAGRRRRAVTTQDDVGPEAVDGVAGVRGGHLARRRRSAYGLTLGQTVPLTGDPGDPLIGQGQGELYAFATRPASTRRSTRIRDYWLGDLTPVRPVIRALSARSSCWTPRCSSPTTRSPRSTSHMQATGRVAALHVALVPRPGSARATGPSAARSPASGGSSVLYPSANITARQRHRPADRHAADPRGLPGAVGGRVRRSSPSSRWGRRSWRSRPWP